MYKFGTIVLVPFPFTDLTSVKLRPALIISGNSGHFGDVILAFVSSKISSSRADGDFLLKTNHRDFKKTGLKAASVFKFSKLATLDKKLLVGELGKLSSGLISEMKKSFEAAFGFF